MMKRSFARLLALCMILPLASPAAAQRISLVDRIVAVVNSEVVTYSELVERTATAERQMRRQNTPVPDPRVLERQVLERLILEKALLQLAKETGLRVDEVGLDACDLHPTTARYSATFRLCTSSVAAKRCPPVPVATK